MANVLLERETVEGEAVEALLNDEWSAYLEREVAGEVKAAGTKDASTRRKPRQSDEEIAAEAARFAEEAMANEE